MRILHVPYSYFPEPAGGTEVYVSALAASQRTLGCDVAVAAPAAVKASHEHEGIRVWRFAISSTPSLRQLYGEGDKTAARGFQQILDQFSPDIIHLHAFTSAVSIRLAEEASKHGIPVFFNYHTPTVSCLRGTLLKWGSEICDGRLDQYSCTACTLHGQGIPRPLAASIAKIPASLSCRFGRAHLAGGVWTALRMPELVDVRIQSVYRLMKTVERVFALCEWTRDILIRNGLPQHKITLCRQGISWNTGVPPEGASSQVATLPLRAAFLGRFDPTKGVHVIVEAMKNNPALPIRLDLFGIPQGDASNRYAARIRAMMGDDPRIRMLPQLPPSEVVSCLRNYDFIVVPSQWLETGPLVVLEAFAAGIPVVGSDLGGIAELVRNGVDGVLIDPANSPAAWARSFRELCSNPDRLLSLRSGIRPPRHASQAAIEMIRLYEDAIATRQTRLTSVVAPMHEGLTQI